MPLCSPHLPGRFLTVPSAWIRLFLLLLSLFILGFQQAVPTAWRPRDPAVAEALGLRPLCWRGLRCGTLLAGGLGRAAGGADAAMGSEYGLRRWGTPFASSLLSVDFFRRTGFEHWSKTCSCLAGGEMVRGCIPSEWGPPSNPYPWTTIPEQPQIHPAPSSAGSGSSEEGSCPRASAGGREEGFSPGMWTPQAGFKALS